MALTSSDSAVIARSRASTSSPGSMMTASADSSHATTKPFFMNGGAAASKMRTGYHSGMIIALVDESMFGSRIRAASDRANAGVTFVRSRDALLPEVLAARPPLVILDLDRD